MFLYRSNFKNTRTSVTQSITYEETKKYQILRMMDYTQSECKNLIETDRTKQIDTKSRLTSSSFYSQSRNVKQRIEQIRTELNTKYSESYKLNEKSVTTMSSSEIKTAMDSYRYNGERSIRRMGFVNPQLANDIIRMQKNGFLSYEDLVKKKEASYDYGDDDKSVLYVNGNLRTTVYGSMTYKEKSKVNNVIEKYNKMSSKK